MAEEFDDLDLSTLNDEELTEQVHDDLYNGLRDEVIEATNILLGRGWSASRVLDDALVEGMRIVGVDFRDGILFVPEVLLAANAMKGGMEILRPLLAETGVEPIGKMVIGTVKGDIHDIGKNLVGMMMEGAGFEVIDLGINNPVEKYLAALEEHKPDILGLSALLTTTMPYMKVVIDTLKEKGLREEVVEATNILLGRGWSAARVLDDALVEGMRIVGVDFRDGILFVPEVLLAANAMKGGMEILRPLLAETGVAPIGKMVIGTVKGDIHDIGKNLVGMMMEGAGFEVIDLGINNPVEKYLAALEEHKPDILGLSALLTTTMPYMKVVIDTLKEKGLRDDFIVLVGGAPLNEEFGKAVGADAYCRDAGIAVETAKTLIAARRAAAAA